MKVRRFPKRATKQEAAYVRDLRRRSALKMLDEGEATVVPLEEYPEPLRRFLRRERTMVHVKLSTAAIRKLETESRKAGLPPDKLARRWIEENLRRNAG